MPAHSYTLIYIIRMSRHSTHAPYGETRALDSTSALNALLSNYELGNIANHITRASTLSLLKLTGMR